MGNTSSVPEHLFAGYVNMNALQLKGFSHATKDRWVVITPRSTPRSQRSRGVGAVRLMMLVYRNANEAEPRTKLWLDGASIVRVGQDAVLRLHPNQVSSPVPGAGELVLHAAPGESDEDFERRLASVMGGRPADSRVATTAPSSVSSRVSSRSAAHQQQQQQSAGGGGLYSGIGGSNRVAGAGSGDSSSSSDSWTPSAPPAAAGLPAPSESPFRPLAGAVSQSIQPDEVAGTGRAAAASLMHKGPVTATTVMYRGCVGMLQCSRALAVYYFRRRAAMGSMAVGGDVDSGAAGSVAAGSVAVGGGAEGGAAGSDAECCVICWSNPREVGFLHGASAHMCACKECSELIGVGTPCPMCRQLIERILDVY